MTQSSDLFTIPERFFKYKEHNLPRPNILGQKEYLELYSESVNNPDQFWRKRAQELINWFEPFEKVSSGSFQEGNVKWFEGGSLNASYNCLDRHVKTQPNAIAINYEGDEPNSGYKLTYQELKDKVCQFSNLLKSKGIKKGDTVAVYMSMVPEAVIGLLACARLGVTHSVVFAGFSSKSLAQRIQHCKAKILLVSNEGKRGGKSIPLKKIADEALESCPSVETVIVFDRTNTKVNMQPGRDIKWTESNIQSRDCPPVPVSSEHPLFILYTSGSTGAPKGLVHTTGGYLVSAAMCTKYIFDAHPGDVFGCTADVGWITSHTFLIYGPLLLGLETVLFESIPTYPNPDRFWKMIEDHKITQFYTSPTALRALRKFGNKWVEPYKMESLRVIGTAGEPIDPETWKWYHSQVGKGKCPIVDTYWQTETGSCMISPLPAASHTKPGAAVQPVLGVDLVLLDPQDGKVLEGNNVQGLLAIRQPWPSMARTVHGDHDRYLKSYFTPYPGFYFTGDGGLRDEDGFVFVTGRVDDVINVSGHRLSTSEVESTINSDPRIAESAVVAIPDEITGQAICCFLTLKPEFHDQINNHKEVTSSIVKLVRSRIGGFAAPKKIVLVSDLPKTRSGKIVRRVLRKVIVGNYDFGDLSSIGDPNVVQLVINEVQAQLGSNLNARL